MIGKEKKQQQQQERVKQQQQQETIKQQKSKNQNLQTNINQKNSNTEHSINTFGKSTRVIATGYSSDSSGDEPIIPRIISTQYCVTTNDKNNNKSNNYDDDDLSLINLKLEQKDFVSAFKLMKKQNLYSKFDSIKILDDMINDGLFKDASKIIRLDSEGVLFQRDQILTFINKFISQNKNSHALECIVNFSFEAEFPCRDLLQKIYETKNFDVLVDWIIKLQMKDLITEKLVLELLENCLIPQTAKLLNEFSFEQRITFLKQIFQTRQYPFQFYELSNRLKITTFLQDYLPKMPQIQYPLDNPVHFAFDYETVSAGFQLLQSSHEKSISENWTSDLPNEEFYLYYNFTKTQSFSLMTQKTSEKTPIQKIEYFANSFIDEEILIPKTPSIDIEELYKKAIQLNLVPFFVGKENSVLVITRKGIGNIYDWSTPLNSENETQQEISKEKKMKLLTDFENFSKNSQESSVEITFTPKLQSFETDFVVELSKKKSIFYFIADVENLSYLFLHRPNKNLRYSEVNQEDHYQQCAEAQGIINWFLQNRFDQLCIRTYNDHQYDFILKYSKIKNLHTLTNEKQNEVTIIKSLKKKSTKETRNNSKKKHHHENKDKKKIIESVIGIDCEWKTQSKKGSKPHPSILQIATPDTVVIFDLISVCDCGDEKLRNLFNEKLGFLFENEKIAKIGCGLGDDMKHLAFAYPTVNSFNYVNSYIDLQSLFKLKSKLPLSSLSVMCQLTLGMSLNKGEQCSNWESRPLSTSQIEYAALDALVLVVLCAHVLQAEEKIEFPVDVNYSNFEVNIRELHKCSEYLISLGKS